MQDIKYLRGQIDMIDKQIVDLFQQRMEVSQNVARYKIANHIPVLDPQREREVLEAKAAMVETPELKADIAKLFETIMSMSRASQRRVMDAQEPEPPGFFRQYSQVYAPVSHPRVVYQGMPGAYSEAAAVNFFGYSVRSRGLPRFEDSFEALQNGEADYAVLPIENSTTGAIRQVHDLLGQYDFFMVGETTVKVEHCLMALPGTTLEDITHVYSHEQGLFQSDRFLDEHPDWVRVPLLDTAGSAKYVSETGDKTKAAICSRRAAEVYGLNILAEHVNHNGENYTRFAVIRAKPELRPGSNKITAVFTPRPEVGVPVLCGIHRQSPRPRHGGRAPGAGPVHRPVPHCGQLRRQSGHRRRRMKNIVIIGMMGCGKSTCGRNLSALTGMTLVDTDQLITERTGKTPSEIFAEQGEQYFRDLETDLCRELSTQSGLIIATGGGLPLREENRRLLRENGVVVFLNRPVEDIFNPEKLKDRPLAQMGKEDFLKRFAERAPIYREMAHHEVEIAPVKEETARKVLAVWEKEAAF